LEKRVPRVEVSFRHSMANVLRFGDQRMLDLFASIKKYTITGITENRLNRSKKYNFNNQSN